MLNKRGLSPSFVKKKPLSKSIWGRVESKMLERIELVAKSLFRQNAFTLSEVVLVLTVIGVVAALTIPTLTNRINDSRYKTAAKKLYSDIAQAYMMKKTEDNFGNMEYAIKDKMRILKYCGSTNIENNCWSTIITGKSMLDDGGLGLGLYGCAVLANGSFVCLLADGGIGVTAAEDSTINGIMLIDVNGKATPNTICKDIFYLGWNTSVPVTKPISKVADGGTDYTPICSTDWAIK